MLLIDRIIKIAKILNKIRKMCNLVSSETRKQHQLFKLILAVCLNCTLTVNECACDERDQLIRWPNDDWERLEQVLEARLRRKKIVSWLVYTYYWFIKLVFLLSLGMGTETIYSSIKQNESIYETWYSFEFLSQIFPTVFNVLQLFTIFLRAKKLLYV